MKPYIALGIAQQGDGIFFTAGTVTIRANDEITVDSVPWKLTKKVEAETMPDGSGSGETIYQGWIAVRKLEA